MDVRGEAGNETPEPRPGISEPDNFLVSPQVTNATCRKDCGSDSQRVGGRESTYLNGLVLDTEPPIDDLEGHYDHTESGLGGGHSADQG